METSNTALIQDEILINISNVIEKGWPAGPSFLFSLGSLIEAAVIHDKVYFDPMGHTLEDDSNDDRLPSLLLQSDFVQQLIREEILSVFPQSTAIKQHLQEEGSSYEYGQFVADYYHELVSFSIANPEGDSSSFRNLIDLAKTAPQVFTTHDLVIRGALDNSYTLLTGPGVAAYALGFNHEDLRIIEGLSRRAKGYLELAQTMGMNLYPVLTALPYQIGAIKRYTSKAQALFESIVDHAVSLDEADEEFSRIEIPPLTQIVLANCKDTPKALANEIVELRYRHRKFRDYLTNYERVWKSANTRGERNKLRQEFDNAWKAFVAKQEKPSTRIIYTLWDIFRNPVNIVKEVGDKLRSYGHELSIIGKVNGLHDFWVELAINSPVPDRNQQLISKLFPRLADDAEWELSNELAQSVNSFLLSKEPKAEA